MGVHLRFLLGRVAVVPVVMVPEGCENAVVLDGGGSSQSWWNGKYTHMSSGTLAPTDGTARPL